MSRLDSEPEVVQLAEELGVDGTSNAVNNIIAFCLMQIRRWVKEAGQITSIEELEALVCRRFGLVFVEIWTDEDLDRLIDKYVGLHEYVFATLRDDLDHETYGSMIRRKHATADATDRFVAVIDCRERKAQRRFFTKWHEIAHLLTLRQFQFRFNRSTPRCPVERVMDAIATEIGFYGPLFGQVVKAEAGSNRRLSFRGVESIRESYCREASFQATLLAAVRHYPRPLIYLEAGLGLKKQEQALLNSKQRFLIPETEPTAKLRVRLMTMNDAAQAEGFRIDWNMQVPPNSLIARCFDNLPVATSAEGIERLDDWRHSNGDAVGSGIIHIQVRPKETMIAALVQPSYQ